ncbi:MAG: NAD(P)/FAD-dependent oxidoreductase [Alphaproteobacteria bacterium]|jgi:D-amino-acid dehydrogenase
MTEGHVTIIGAGIVGVSCALHLLKDGWRVSLIDEHPAGTQTSYGNAGAISPQSINPMSGPGIIKQIPKWLLDPLGPLAIRWSYLPKAMPWFMQFIRDGAATRVASQSEALAALHRNVIEGHEELAELANVKHLIKRQGWLSLYETDAAFKADAAARARMQSHGHEIHELNPDEISQLEPGLAPIFKHATWAPNSGHTVNPGALTEAYAKQASRMGCEFVNCKVLGFEIGPEGPTKIRTSAGEFKLDRLVIAAGAWSSQLSKQLGEPFPLESERGYHMMLPSPGFTTRRPVSFNERKFMTTTMEEGLRLAGTVEFAGLEAPPNWGRAIKLLEHAKTVFRDVDVSDAKRWMGQRPATPDSLPVISSSKVHEKVFYAFGHGHLGLTGSAVTGAHIASLVSRRNATIDLQPFRIDRYR